MSAPPPPPRGAGGRAAAGRGGRPPHFFGFNADLGLQYRGRLDASRREPGSGDEPRELYEAMKAVAETGRGPAEQVPSMGCSIKWKAA